MNTHKFYRSIFASSLAGVALLVTSSCTKLETTPYGLAVVGQFPKTASDYDNVAGAAYNQFRGIAYNDIWFLNEISTDEILIPTRGPDWYDGGQYKYMLNHTWTQQVPAAINGAWNFAYSTISTVNLDISNFKSSADGGKTAIGSIAELRALRALAYFYLIDLYGNVPIITETSPAGSIPQNTRAQVFSFIESELKAALPNLKAANYGKPTKSFAYTLLAKLYLNAGVYTGTPNWAGASAYCDSVTKTGLFSLAGNFFDVFAVANRSKGASEIIFVAPMDKVYAPGQNIEMRTLHYKNQATYNLNAAPWNGYCTTSDFYNKFTGTDARKNQYITGAQKDINGAPITYTDAVSKKTGPLVMVTSITSFDSARQNEGARFKKYEIQVNNTQHPDQDNDFVIFRYADILMMKAEAAFRLGDVATALTNINLVRSRANAPLYTSLVADTILAERGREFVLEMSRRNDLIRFGKFNSGKWQFQSSPNVDPSRNLFPIPNQQLSSNPSLKQNAGY